MNVCMRVCTYMYKGIQKSAYIHVCVCVLEIYIIYIFKRIAHLMDSCCLVIH